MAYALGIEFSTQSAKTVVLDTESGDVVHVDQLSYDDEFPSYGTDGGVLPSDDPARRHTSPLMMVEALDRVFERLAEAAVRLDRVAALKIDGQQHCSVYTNGAFLDRLRALHDAGDAGASQSLAWRLNGCFARATAPIWEDRTTAAEAEELTAALKGYGGVEVLTGNRAELRFPASQILRWAGEDPTGYDGTDRILVLSAFITSILVGALAPVDTGDGWGTNLNGLDLASPGWNPAVLEVMNDLLAKRGATATLSEKLGLMDHYDAAVGPIAPYFAGKYGVNPAAMVLAGTGDNPATLLGCGGRVVISLGSSYTVNGVMAEVAPSPTGEYNVFGYADHSAMALSVITNGGKLHDEFRDRYAGGSWEEYAHLAAGGAAKGPADVGRDEPLMLPYRYAESVPVAPAGIVRDGFGEDGAAANVRALHLSQALSLRLHSSHLEEVGELAVVGGGSRNAVFRQMITDLFGVPTYRIRNADSAAPLGCAISAARWAEGLSYADAANRYVQREPDSEVHPEPSRRGAYDALLKRYRALEEGHRA
ncbi:MAG: FGGY-family carbohydrate kinase [bacterium]